MIHSKVAILYVTVSNADRLVKIKTLQNATRAPSRSLDLTSVELREPELEGSVSELFLC